MYASCIWKEGHTAWKCTAFYVNHILFDRIPEVLNRESHCKKETVIFMRDYSKTWACDFPHLSGYLWVPKPESWNSSSTAFLCELQQLVTKYFSFQLLKYLTCVFSSPPWSTSLCSWNDCNRVSCVLPSNFVSSPSTSSQNEFSMIFYIHWKLFVVSPTLRPSLNQLTCIISSPWLISVYSLLCITVYDTPVIVNFSGSSNILSSHNLCLILNTSFIKTNIMVLDNIHGDICSSNW